jgi:Calx-beta domain/RTX calcium-binding nonapeptide repeat (4 copies)
MRKRSVRHRAIVSGLVVAIVAGLLVGAVSAATVVGTAGDDVLKGSAKNDKLYGKTGDDKLYGLVGNDLLRGGPGNDVLRGGPGNDALVGGPGADVLNCGPGQDVARVDAQDRVNKNCETVKGLPSPPVVSIDNASTTESDSGTKILSLPVTLSAVSTKPVTVGFATADGTATAGSDYLSASGTLTFNPGETSKTVDVTINGDTTVEPDEDFVVSLSSAVNATLGADVGTGTIQNDDRPPVALVGRYCGFNDQGKSVCLDVTGDGSTVTNFRTETIVGCTNGAQGTWTLTFSRSTVTIQPDLSFLFSFSGPLSSSDSSLTNITAAYSISGTFDTVGNVSGTLALPHISFDQDGVHYDCSSAPFAWRAKLNA